MSIIKHVIVDLERADKNIRITKNDTDYYVGINDPFDYNNPEKIVAVKVSKEQLIELKSAIDIILSIDERSKECC